MKLTQVGPPKTEIINNDSEQAVVDYAELVRDEAGKIILSATESEGTQPDGRVVTVEKADVGDGIEAVEVVGKPSIMARLMRRKPKDAHRIERRKDGTVVYETRRESALGGEVIKTATVEKDSEGRDLVSYGVTRIDSKGRVVPRRGRGAFRSISSESRGSFEESKKDGERRRKAVIQPADAIRNRVMGALSSYDPVEMGRSRRKVGKNGRFVQQVPRGARKYRKAYDKRRDIEEAESEDVEWRL